MRRAVARAALAALAACSGKPRTDEAPRAPAAGDAGSAAGSGPAGSGSAGSGSAGSGSAEPGDARPGDLQVRVEWRDAPVAARTSPGRTPCNTPRVPSVAPTTTWGVPEALVIVDGAPPTPSTAGAAAAPIAAPASARVVLADCALVPRVAAGTELAITSAADRPARVVLRKRGALDAATGAVAAGDPIAVLLPIAGHTVAAALDAGAIYSLETDAAEPELAFVAALPARVTDATGHAMFRGLAPGAHAVTAWVPPRAGQPARIGRGTATVAGGDLAELTISIAPAP